MKPSSLIAAFLLLAPTAVAAQETIRLAPGKRAAIVLKENPSTGYVWRIDEGASAGLDAIAIEDEGHTRGANMPGAPGTHRWTIRARRPGRALVNFEYRRPWEPAPVETRQVVVIVR